jgi:hypothetical protein
VQTTELARKAISGFAEQDAKQRLKVGHGQSAFAEGMDSQQWIDRQNREIRAMPVEKNAESTVFRILNRFREGGTDDRFYEFLKQRIEPDHVLEPLKQGKNPGLTPEQMKALAVELKRLAGDFMKAERADAEKIGIPDGAGKIISTRDKPGGYLNEGLQPGERVVDLNKPQPRPKAETDPGSPERSPLKDIPSVLGAPKYRTPLDEIIERARENPKLQSVLENDSDGRVLTALAAAAQKAGLREIDAVVLSTDRTKVIAMQGDPNTGAELKASVDIPQTLKQSSAEFAQNVAVANRPVADASEQQEREQQASKAPRMG